MAPVALFIFSLLTHLVVLHSTEELKINKHCHPEYCNEKVRMIQFPFKSQTHPPECGGLFTVDCSDQDNPRIQLKEKGYWHELESISETNTIFINDRELQQRLEHSLCDDQIFDNLSLPSPSPIFDEIFAYNLTLFKCNNTHLPNTVLKSHCKNDKHTYYNNSSSDDSLVSHLPLCTIIQIPFDPNQYTPSLTEFQLRLRVSEECERCYFRNGTCLVDNKGKFQCSVGEKGDKLGLKLGLGIGCPVLIAVCLFLLWHYKQKRAASNFLSRNISSQPHTNSDQDRQIVEAFLRSYGPLQVRRYSYLEVKKMTNSFEEKLGQGGYGSVYKGKSNDGSLVAVKVLNKLKGNGEEFMNEVAAISRTSHVNIVSLWGFCFEGSKRALIYEFMPNGSLEKFIFDANTPNKNHHLGWEALDRIALGIARGLEYLHRGCNTRILHFDIKPHNILLDENFTPKVSDFGLAKICNMKESIVSMACARGTAGYIAPEVFCRNFGAVSHKSDVYSYGMMLSEMVGGRRNINAEAEDTSEIYFPHWIYKRLELDEELGLPSIMEEEDKVRARKMIIVSLWCIQTDPSNRPAMKQVIDMLEGSVDCLQIPPKPYLSSPPKPVADSSTVTLVSIE
ncbi:PREDICTED: LEAF RUST 10 DISEASE-RESISTANCE LOCUS RECEPTOR-LIKE PROTEIN KINASE-like 2.4 isoform X2 [Prunus mume]|uniref:LEAF RUST 10 DISEASE-RESISTANCE LOCUS RECEPTOR-LIKE PROTEIN KINASE-like 2.4 isoform X2 n=1 Tax=Prunus mume TaxID=102107 RepID=A0ABM0PR96_PRUMU|nr:PREDICTED: LEAF RUST 10 DISEASE-RESISTANCE LOCUS RECEPTOR-LIKE PROTEIN KINASE-like 2.4 isoform X2 [Prunus mume]